MDCIEVNCLISVMYAKRDYEVNGEHFIKSIKYGEKKSDYFGDYLHLVVNSDLILNGILITIWVISIPNRDYKHPPQYMGL